MLSTAQQFGLPAYAYVASLSLARRQVYEPLYAVPETGFDDGLPALRRVQSGWKGQTGATTFNNNNTIYIFIIFYDFDFFLPTRVEEEGGGGIWNQVYYYVHTTICIHFVDHLPRLSIKILLQKKRFC